MRIVIAPDKFKGSLGARSAAEAMARGVRSAVPSAEIELCPMSDGGEGFVEAIVAASGGRVVDYDVTGPLPEMRVSAPIGLIDEDRTAVIEMAAASGLHLLRRDQYDVPATTTFGTGELIARAAGRGCRRVLLGLGGSAGVDGGIGCAQACGLPVILEGGEPIAMSEPLCGRDVSRVVLIKHGRGSIVDGLEIVTACDVDNPLFGANGAALTYGPQKGADAAVAAKLDRDLEQLARRCGQLDAARMPGAGAAGGLGFAMAAFFGATLRGGFEVVAETVRLGQRLAGADLCITGEGRLDRTSGRGKVVGGVAAMCAAAGVRCVAICGEVECTLPGLAEVLAISEGVSAAEARTRAAELVERAAARIAQGR